MTYFVLVMFLYTSVAVPMPSRYKSLDKCKEAAEVAKNSYKRDGLHYACIEVMYPP